MMGAPSREMILGIINSFDTGSLLDMLATKGINISNPGGGELNIRDDDQPLEVWNDRRVATSPDNRPRLFDKSKHIAVSPEQQQQYQVPDYLTREPDTSLEQYGAQYHNAQGGL